MKGNEGSGNFTSLFYYFFFFSKGVLAFRKRVRNVDPKGLSGNINGFGEAESWFLGEWCAGCLTGVSCQAHYTHMYAGCWTRHPLLPGRWLSRVTRADEKAAHRSRKAHRKQLCRHTNGGPASLKCTHKTEPHPLHCPKTNHCGFSSSWWCQQG